MSAIYPICCCMILPKFLDDQVNRVLTILLKDSYTLLFLTFFFDRFSSLLKLRSRLTWIYSFRIICDCWLHFLVTISVFTRAQAVLVDWYLFTAVFSSLASGTIWVSVHTGGHLLLFVLLVGCLGWHLYEYWVYYLASRLLYSKGGFILIRHGRFFCVNSELNFLLLISARLSLFKDLETYQFASLKFKI